MLLELVIVGADETDVVIGVLEIVQRISRITTIFETHRCHLEILA
jgi:hypothetical protein